MREIKFRAWHKIRKEWVYLTVHHRTDTLTLDSKWAIFGGDLEPWQQYTGLRDKNGKEIYEGNVVRLHCFNHNLITATITWLGDGRAEFYPVIHKKEITVDGGTSHGKRVRMGEVHTWAGMHNCFSFSRYTEIIGNIYENPELLSS